MFISVMSILQERLPCSTFYFRTRRQFKHQMRVDRGDATMSIDQVSANSHLNARATFDTQSRQSHRTIASNRSKISGNAESSASYVTAIAEPRMIQAWSPSKKTP